MANNELFGNTLSGASLEVTPTLITWTQVVTVMNYLSPNVQYTEGNNAGGDILSGRVFPPLDCYKNRSLQLPQVGDQHTGYAGAYATRVVIEPYTNDSGTHMRLTTRWELANRFSQIHVGSYQQVEVRNYDSSNKLAVVPYRSPTYSATFNPKTPFVASLRSIKVIRNLQVTQYEVIKGNGDEVRKLLIETDEAVWNQDAIWGYEPGELLFVGSESTSEGTPLYRKGYNFLVSPSSRGGWHHVFAIFTDSRGLVPGDTNNPIVPIDPSKVKASDGSITHNGAAAFKVLTSKKFNDLFSKLKPPFGATSAFGS